MAKKPLGTKPRKRITVKQKIYAEQYVETRGNGVQSALIAYGKKDKPLTYETANSISTENLHKPLIRMEILHLMKQNGVEIPEILGIHRRNMLQDEHLPTSQKAVSDFYEILGMKDAQKPTNDVKIAFVIEK